jgi:hypothetical protein
MGRRLSAHFVVTERASVVTRSKEGGVMLSLPSCTGKGVHFYGNEAHSRVSE